MLETLIEGLGRMVWPAGSQGRLAVLMYHRVLSVPDPLRPWDVNQELFGKQMRLLKNHFNVLPLREAVNRLSNGDDLPKLAVSITFDDGYRDNHDVALPILKEYGLPATFFVATGYLDGGCMFNDLFIESVRAYKSELDLQSVGLGVHQISTIEQKLSVITNVLPKLKYLPFQQRSEISETLAQNCGAIDVSDMMMSSSQVRALRQAGMEIGGHTVRHPILANEDFKTASDDIIEGKRYLESLLGESVEAFAYPNGRPGEDYRREHVDLLLNLGFRYAVSTAWGIAGHRSDRFQIPRLLPWDKDMLRFQARLVRSLWGEPEKRV